jgi:hypothetical protein
LGQCAFFNGFAFSESEKRIATREHTAQRFPALRIASAFFAAVQSEFRRMGQPSIFTASIVTAAPRGKPAAFVSVAIRGRMGRTPIFFSAASSSARQHGQHRLKTRPPRRQLVWLSKGCCSA